MIEIEKINGYEILDYLNSLFSEDDSPLYDIACCGPLTFEKQAIQDDSYRLWFTAQYNNWGTYQDIHHNHIIINGKGEVRVAFDEPLDSDESSDVIEETITNWIKTHTFSDNVKEDFNELIKITNANLSTLEYGDSEKLEEVINQLIKAKTLIK